MSQECSADLDHVCDGSNDGQPCDSCDAERDYWRRRLEHLPTREEIDDCYSDPTEQAKREGLLRRLGLDRN